MYEHLYLGLFCGLTKLFACRLVKCEYGIILLVKYDLCKSNESERSVKTGDQQELTGKSVQTCGLPCVYAITQLNKQKFNRNEKLTRIGCHTEN